MQATLGTYTKSIHAARGARTKSSPEQAAAKAGAKSGRYALQRTAQGLLWKKGVEWREQHRTCWCHRHMKRESETVSVFRNVDGSGASLAGLNVCGEIWTCPVCAAKIAEERRKDLNAGMVAHVANGGAAYLLTLTFPHEADHNLFVMLERFTKARQRLQNSRTWKRVMEEAGRIGAVASLEFTVSQENGWHPHLHLLVFADKGGLGEGDPVNEQGDLDSPAIRELQKQWVNTLLKTGLGDGSKITHMMQHALNVRGGEKAAEYIAKFGRDEKWGMTKEITGSYAKAGAVGQRDGQMHFTPFQLLVWAGQGDGWAAAKFTEYAKAVAGKRALTWSPGLKKALLGTEDERTDEEIAADDAMRPEQEDVGELQRDQYQDIFRRNRLPDFMRYVAEHARGQQDLDDYVESIRQLPAEFSGAVIIKGVFHGKYAVN